MPSASPNKSTFGQFCECLYFNKKFPFQLEVLLGVRIFLEVPALETMQWLGYAITNNTVAWVCIGVVDACWPNSLLYYVPSQQVKVLEERTQELERENDELQRSLREKEQIADQTSVHLDEVRSSGEEAKRQLDDLREERDQLNEALAAKHGAVDKLEDEVYLLQQE